MAGWERALAILPVVAAVQPVPALAQAPADVPARCAPVAPVAGQARRVTPCGSPQFWIDPDKDFGDLPEWKTASGQIAFRLDIDEAGAISGCTIVASNVAAAIETRFCQVLRRQPRFRPAYDATARPIASSYSNRIRLYGGEPARVPLESWARTARVEFDGERLVRCDVLNEGGASGAQVYMCDDPDSGTSGLYDARQKPRVFVRQIQYLAPGQTLTTNAETPKGEPFARTVMGVDLSEDGEVQRCILLAEEGAKLYPQLCRPELSFLPLPRGKRAPRSMMRIETVWVVPAETH